MNKAYSSKTTAKLIKSTAVKQESFKNVSFENPLPANDQKLEF